MTRYLLTRKGLLSSNILECGGFVDTAGTGRADIQFHFMPAFSLASDGAHDKGHGIGFSACVLQPESRGHVRLRSADPTVKIELSPKVLSAQADVSTLMRGLKLGLQFLESDSMKSVVDMRTLPAGDIQSDALLENHIAATAKTVFHPVGTCKMGASNDPQSVVDAELRVNGVEGLRIADASVMPTIVSGNTNAAAIMIAERASRFIIESAR